MTTFEAEIGSLTLVPSVGGVFDVRVDGETVWSRAEHGGHADLADLKRLVRDRIAPGRTLGHTDRR